MIDFDANRTKVPIFFIMLSNPNIFISFQITQFYHLPFLKIRIESEEEAGAD
jgi:hypothetical protein